MSLHPTSYRPSRPSLRFTLRSSAGAIALALGALSAIPSPAGAQVTYFQRPPTPEQLRAALLAPATSTTTAAPSPMQAAPAPAATSPLPSGTRTRGIVWSTATSAGSSTTASAAGSAAAPVPSAGAGMQAPAQIASPASPATPGSPAAALPINFDLGSSRIDSASLPYLETIASVLRTDPSLHLVIEGHTDDRGSYNRNMVLSWDRALGVFRTLVESYGIDPRRLQPVGKGPLEPMPGTAPADGA
ncbi:MAG: OmpA family protein, partial [Lautropia sp.]